MEKFRNGETFGIWSAKITEEDITQEIGNELEKQNGVTFESETQNTLVLEKGFSIVER